MSFLEKEFVPPNTDELFPQLLDPLMNFGLTRSEAKVYVALVRLGEGKGDSVAQHSGIARQEAYRVLANLEKLEIVDRVVASPTLFMPLPPSSALAKLMEKREKESQRKITELQEIMRETVAQLDSIKSEVKQQTGYVRRLHNKRILEREIELVRDSKEKILLAAPAKELALLHQYGGTAAIGLRLIQQHESASIICTADEPLFEQLKQAYRNIDVRCLWEGGVLGGHFLIVDSAITVVRVGEKRAIETDEEMFVRLMENTFQLLWRRAEKRSDL